MGNSAVSEPAAAGVLGVFIGAIAVMAAVVLIWRQPIQVQVAPHVRVVEQAPPRSNIGRYQLVVSEGVVMVIDTATGLVCATTPKNDWKWRKLEAFPVVDVESD